MGRRALQSVTLGGIRDHPGREPAWASSGWGGRVSGLEREDSDKGQAPCPAWVHAPEAPDAWGEGWDRLSLTAVPGSSLDLPLFPRPWTLCSWTGGGRICFDL